MPSLSTRSAKGEARRMTEDVEVMSGEAKVT